MTALIRAELLKLRTVRMTTWLLVTCLCLVALDCLAIVATAAPGYGPGEVHDPHLFALGIGAAGVGEVVLLVLGILCVTQEFRFRTDTASFLVTPRRGLVVVAKLVAVALTGAVFAAASIALVIPLSMMLVSMKGGTLVWDREVVEIPLGVMLVLLLYGPIGIAIGALVRNQIGAIAGSLAWLFVVEQILIALFPAVGRWTPGGATTGVLQLGQIATTRGDMLPAWPAALLLAAYAGVIAFVGTRSTLRRDIT
jgi:hypothetical protein